MCAAYVRTNKHKDASIPDTSALMILDLEKIRHLPPNALKTEHLTFYSPIHNALSGKIQSVTELVGPVRIAKLWLVIFIPF